MSGCGCGGAGAPASACGCAVGDGSIPGRDDPGRAERRAWCGTGAKDDGKLFPATPASAPVLPPGTSLRLTPFGAYAAEPGAPAGLATFEVADRYRIAHRAGFTGRLVPSGPNVLQPDPTTALEPSGSVFPPTAHEMAAFVPREQWAQLPTTLRAAARARGFQPQREFHPAAGLLLPEGAEPLLAHLADATVRCGSPYYATEDECMEWRDDDPFSEGKWWLSVVCPGAVYDPVQAAACLDQVLHSPLDCEGIWYTPACGNMDWYRGVCSEVNSAA